MTPVKFSTKTTADDEAAAKIKAEDGEIGKEEITSKRTTKKAPARRKKVAKAVEPKEKTTLVKKEPVKISVLKQQVVLPTVEGESEEKKEEGPVEKRGYFNEAKEEVKKQIAAVDLSMAKIETKVDEKKVEKSSLTPRSMPTKPTNTVKPQEFKPSVASVKKEWPDEEKTEVKPKHSLKLYRNIVGIFIAATIILALVIGYFVFVKVEITLTPNQENLNNNLILDIYDKEKNTEVGGNGILGVVKKVSIKTEKKYKVTGEEVIGKEAIGEATIINSYEKNQPLVATTRLLTADGKLFRIKDTVNVPAGGSIKVAIYADQPSEAMAIPPSKFTIPGLWAGLQDKIYAQSDQAVVYQQKVKRSVTEEDLENSLLDLKTEVVNKAKEEIANNYKEYSKIIYNLDEKTLVSKVDAKVGEEKDEFTGSVSADVIVVAFDETKAKTLAKEKIILALADDKELVNFDDQNITYALNNSDIEKGVATVNAAFSGKVTLKDSSQIVDKNKILGLTKDQLNAYLGGLPDIASYEVKFSPSFLWKVPPFMEPSKIQIEVKK